MYRKVAMVIISFWTSAKPLQGLPRRSTLQNQEHLSNLIRPAQTDGNLCTQYQIYVSNL